MKEDTKAKLVEIAKRKCKITWQDDDDEQRIIEIVEDADVTMRHMLGMTGASADAFLEPGQAKTLFKEYCLYAWNNVIDQFEDNYRKEIIAERHKNEVKNHAEANANV